MVYSKTHNNCNHEVFNQFTYYLVKNPLFQESIENEVFPNKMHYIAQNSTSTKSINCVVEMKEYFTHFQPLRFLREINFMD